MIQIKNDPNELLKKEGISKKLLSEPVREALGEYAKSVKELEDFKEDKSMIELVENMGKGIIDVLTDEIAEIKDKLKDDEVEKEKRQVKKAQSKKIVEKTEKSMEYLSQCRQLLKQERKKKIESGEIKQPVKKRLTTKLSDSMKRIVNMMPKAIKDDKSKIEKTEKAINKFLSDLKCIWGMNKIKPVEDEMKKKFDSLKETAKKNNN